MRKNTISLFVKENRKKYGLSQKELAKETKVGLRFLRELEQGKETLMMNKVNQVLGFFGKEIVVGDMFDPLPYRMEDSIIIKHLTTPLKENLSLFNFRLAKKFLLLDKNFHLIQTRVLFVENEMNYSWIPITKIKSYKDIISGSTFISNDCYEKWARCIEKYSYDPSNDMRFFWYEVVVCWLLGVDFLCVQDHVEGKIYRLGKKEEGDELPLSLNWKRGRVGRKDFLNNKTPIVIQVIDDILENKEPIIMEMLKSMQMSIQNRQRLERKIRLNFLRLKDLV